ncbi:LysR family transcriptional regulator [Sphingobium sp. AR-3-1]|uniref:LysR family transcriptional regulator n=1 Tax=Sphingobium psychrophilum TaxID=2728834 RepID=A0A7X9ZT81_9SPHN|nr:LysR family transcriptional regulator [Sphingobium psychrophilum]NML11723.1 LysR family transcriptional regulator [Sphingobium psychrophilum]
MNLRQLEILHAIITYNTTVAAAKALGMSQPAISNALRRIEDMVGFQLFLRENNRIFPTAEAKMLIADSRPIFEIHKKIETRVKDIRNNRSGQLRIAATPPLAYSVVTRALERFQIPRPQVRAYFEVQYFEEVIESVEMNHSELGFLVNYTDHPGMMSKTIYRGAMVCIMPAANPLSEKAVITPQDIHDQRLIGLLADTRMGQAIRDAFASAGVQYSASIEVRYAMTACRIVQEGMSLAVVDLMTAIPSLRDGLVFRPFAPEIKVSASAIWAANRGLTRLGDAFVNDVQREADAMFGNMNQA